MKILAIETSCDETSIAIIEAISDTSIRVLSHVVLSQVAIHAEYGGVYPALAKREHAKNLVPVLEQALREAALYQAGQTVMPDNVEQILEREPDLFGHFTTFLEKTAMPGIDQIVVTQGPGLEPALWVGINFAKALAAAWNVPLTPVNHMEGHILSVLIQEKTDSEITLADITYPALALLVSGGHTEIVLMDEPGKYRLIGKTQDDAAGEAFDKAARILDLPYPGGPEISRLAEQGLPNEAIKLPRPMIDSGTYDFSFSGLKTAVLYLVRDLGGIEALSDQTRADIAREFQHAALDVLSKKTLAAFTEFSCQTLIVGGGVSANRALRTMLQEKLVAIDPAAKLLLPGPGLSTDNALMIALVGLFQIKSGKIPTTDFAAEGRLSIVNE